MSNFYAIRYAVCKNCKKEIGYNRKKWIHEYNKSEYCEYCPPRAEPVEKTISQHRNS